jgi:hypothetical protein
MTLPLAVKGTMFITQTATVSERKVPVHLFVSGHRHCNADQCLNNTAFSLSSGNTCILLPDVGPIHQVILPCDNDDTLIQKDVRHPTLHLAFRIRLKHPGMMLTVGPKTPLSLLFSSGVLHVLPFVGTREQLTCLMAQQQN